MSQKQREKRPMDPPHTPPGSVQSQVARSQQNSITPRTRRDGGGAIPQPQLRVPIAELMQHEMLSCSVESFLDHYAPFSLSPDTLDRVYEQVKEDCLIEPQYPRKPEDKLGWAAFYGCGPSDFGETEPKTFAQLEDIMEVLQSLDMGNDRQLNFRYKNSPNSRVEGEREGSTTFMVDACLRPNDADPQKVYSSEAAVIAEFKLATKRSVVHQNRLQLVSAASYIMNDDPRRMWMYGITIEDEKMSLWYFSRSHSVKSETFDWTRDFKTFTRVFVSFMFATEMEMGFDPTVHRVEVENKIQYVYEVGHRFFLTVKSIFNPRVLCISGRKTRVWRAVEVRGTSKEDRDIRLNGGKEYALKDVWLDSGSDTEGAILRKIFTSLESQTTKGCEWMSATLYDILRDALDKQQYKQYFMEIICEMQGKTSKPPAQGAVADPMILDTTPVEQTEEEVEKSLRTGSSINKNTSKHLGLSGSLPQRNVPLGSRDHAAKRQYRLVYKDVGIPLHDAPNLGSCFDALRDILIALVLMSFAKWVHRDISTGNIIMVQNDDGSFRGKLSDLEYAKKFSRHPAGSKDPKTGTPYFMPYEVHANTAVHPPDSVIDLLSIDWTKRWTAEEQENSSESWSPFYRYEYDVESLWWIIVWTVLARIPHKPAQTLSRQVFTYTSEPSPKRTQIFRSQSDPSIRNAMPPALKKLVPSIYTMHNWLYGSYEEYYSEFEDYIQIHSSMWDLLEQILNWINNGEIPNLVLLDPDLCLSNSDHPNASASFAPTAGKRYREDGSSDAVGGDNTGREVEAGGSQKRPRIQPENGVTAIESTHPGKYSHHVRKP